MDGLVRSGAPWGGGNLDAQQSLGHRVSAIWELGGTAGPLAVEFGWEGPALGTVTCRMGELETAARSQRERKYRHLGSSSLQRRERQERSERHLVLFFSHCLQQLGHWGDSPAGSPCQEDLPRDNRLSIGSFSFGHPDRDWCYDQESDPTCLGYSSLSQSRRGQLGAPGRPGEDPGVRHPGQVSRLPSVFFNLCQVTASLRPQFPHLLISFLTEVKELRNRKPLYRRAPGRSHTGSHHRGWAGGGVNNERERHGLWCIPLADQPLHP